MENATQNPATTIVLDTATRYQVNNLLALSAQYQTLLQALQAQLEVTLQTATGVDLKAQDWDLDPQRGILTRTK